MIAVSERGLTSAQWSVYNTDTKRTWYSSEPTSDITAETVTVDGFVLSQKDTAGITTTTPRSYTYNHLGQLTQVTDAAGSRTLGYNHYGEQETDSLLAGGKTHLITETRDTMGRSTGYTYAKDGSTQQTVTTGYGTDGRITTAGFMHGGAEKQFSYEYLPGPTCCRSSRFPAT